MSRVAALLVALLDSRLESERVSKEECATMAQSILHVEEKFDPKEINDVPR
jgi:hypothetical protein